MSHLHDVPKDGPCLARNGFGQYCEKPLGHTGNHRARVFSPADALRAFEVQVEAAALRMEQISERLRGA